MVKHIPKVYTIDPAVSFADSLAQGIMTRFSQTPTGLSNLTVLLPTRRACRTLRDAFLRQTQGRALLLPKMQPLGDLDEDELLLTGWSHLNDPQALAPAISPLRRQILLTRLVMSFDEGQITVDQAAQLAKDLAGLLDQCHTEEVSLEGLKTLVPEDYARHWSKTLDFLKILTDHWPAIVASEGCVDPAARRNQILDLQTKIWTDTPPDHPVIAAGSTASMPAVARLLTCIARLPQGMVVLPGFDRHMAADDWAALDATHPQHGLRQLLADMALSPQDVALWHEDQRNTQARVQLLSQALLPAGTTEKWRSLLEPEASAMTGVTRVDCATSHDEAGVIALMMREELTKAGHRAALVTPDRNLARRVASELRRWGIEIDDSAGIPLVHTPVGTFLRLLALCVRDDFAPVALLALCKHPLSAARQDPKQFRRFIRRLELMALRGPRPAVGLAGLYAAVDQREHHWRKRTNRLSRSQKAILEDIRGVLAQLEQITAPFVKVMGRRQSSFVRLLEQHIKAAEALASTLDEEGSQRLWRGEAGEGAASFIAELRQAADGFDDVRCERYPALIEALLQGQAVRPRYGAHPRLAILGLFESRLHHADLMILGGLNEGSWPPEAKASPWMSRPMMKDFGLPQPERVIGQTAHDFAQAFCAQRVVLTRAERVGGTPTVRARWIRRLENRLKGTALEKDFAPNKQWLAWQADLDAVTKIKAQPAPAPRPPVAARPRALYVTNVERWMRDPYAIYARSILKLKALDPLDADPGAAEYGTVIHAALEAFMQAYPNELPDDAVSEVLRIGREAFAKEQDNPTVWAFWWPRFERIADWFIDQEKKRRPLIAKSYTEIEGSLSFDAPAGPFTVSAKADRIDVMKDGTVQIIDYKTGAPPSKKEVAAGFAPQLPLEAALVQAGGFADIGARAVSAIDFWQLKGGQTAGKIHPASDDPYGSGEEAFEGLKALVGAYDRVETPYPSRPTPSFAPKYSDYDHLARVKEWSTAAAEDGEDSA